MISVRLDNQLEEELKQAASSIGLSKSEYVRQTLMDKLTEEKSQKSPWELGKDLFGKYGSNRSDLSQNYKKLIKVKLRVKHSRH